MYRVIDFYLCKIYINVTCMLLYDVGVRSKWVPILCLTGWVPDPTGNRLATRSCALNMNQINNPLDSWVKFQPLNHAGQALLLGLNGRMRVTT